MPDNKITRTEAEWRKILSDEQYRVLREKGTEAPGTGEYYHNDKTGEYACAACGTKLFDSTNKYNSGSGWPSFDQPADKENIESVTDTSHGMARTEVMCSVCGGHLGHVFEDGPSETTGQRYCINSAALKFMPKEEA